MGQGIHNMSPENLVVSEQKNVLKKKKMMGVCQRERRSQSKEPLMAKTGTI